jgi:hypothetical protein
MLPTHFDPWLRMALAALAVWRFTHLLALEDGPFDVLASLRRALGESVFGRLMDCFYCLSFWVAAPFAALVAASLWDGLLAWFALSGAACLLERLGAPPVAIAPLPEEKPR